jgi:hypothetical protein
MTGAAVVLYGRLRKLKTGFTTVISSVGAQRFDRVHSGIQGEPDANASFGFALAAANFGKGQWADLAIGAPLDRHSQGTVSILFGSNKGLTRIGNAFEWQDGSSFEGSVEGDSEEGDDFGSALTGANFGKGPDADLAVGVPGEDEERGPFPGRGQRWRRQCLLLRRNRPALE